MEPPSTHKIHNTDNVILVVSDPITAAAYKKSGLSWWRRRRSRVKRWTSARMRAWESEVTNRTPGRGACAAGIRREWAAHAADGGQTEEASREPHLHGRPHDEILRAVLNRQQRQDLVSQRGDPGVRLRFVLGRLALHRQFPLALAVEHRLAFLGVSLHHRAPLVRRCRRRGRGGRGTTRMTELYFYMSGRVPQRSGAQAGSFLNGSVHASTG